MSLGQMGGNRKGETLELFVHCIIISLYIHIINKYSGCATKVRVLRRSIFAASLENSTGNMTIIVILKTIHVHICNNSFS